MTTKRIQIILDTSSAKKSASDLNNSLRTTEKNASAATFSMNKLASAIATVVSVRQVAQYADAWTRVENQLKRTTSTQAELNGVSEQLLQIANQTRASLEPTVELYTSLSVATRDLGVSQSEIAGVTKTINNLFLESGKGATETAGAIRQLGQALESGALRGDEFNSVAEGAPGILRAVEAQTGLTRAELRKLAEQGQITAELLVASLQSYEEQAQSAADRTKATLAQAFDVAGNNLTFFVGRVNQVTGASDSLAKTIIDLSNLIGSEAFISSFIENFDIARLTINAASDAVSDFDNELRFISDTSKASIGVIGSAFKNLLPNIRSVVQILTTNFATGLEQTKTLAKGALEVLKNGTSIDGVKKAIGETIDQYKLLGDVREQTIDDIFKERDAILKTAEESRKARIAEAEARKADRDSRVIGGPTVSGVGSGGISIGGEKSSGDQEIASAKAVTEALFAELQLRTQTAQIYRDEVLREDASLYEQQLGLIRIREAEALAQIEQRAVADQQRRAEVLAKQLEDEKLSEQAKLDLKYEAAGQQVIAERFLEEQRTQILQEGKKAREDLDRAEFNTRLAMVGQLGDKIMEVSKGKSKGIFKIGQTLALAQAAVALPTAVLESFKNGGGYPWGLIPAGLMLATGLQQINSIKNAGKGLGGGGGSVSVPSLGGGASTSAQIPTTAAQAELTQQRRIIDLRGVASTDKLTVAQFAALMEDDGAIVTLENARIDAERRNVIGVSGR